MNRKVITFDLDENDWLKGVKAISIVDIPAIESNFVALRGETQVKLSQVDEEKRMLFGAVLIPDKLILRRDKDTGEEYYIKFPREAVRKIAYNYMKQGNQSEATFMHEFRIDGCTTVEQWIKESDVDKSVAMGLNEIDGTWFIGMKVDNDGVWEKVKSGEILGFSLEGLFDAVDQQLRSIVDKDIEFITEVERILKEG